MSGFATASTFVPAAGILAPHQVVPGTLALLAVVLCLANGYVSTGCLLGAALFAYALYRAATTRTVPECIAETSPSCERGCCASYSARAKPTRTALPMAVGVTPPPSDDDDDDDVPGSGTRDERLDDDAGHEADNRDEHLDDDAMDPDGDEDGTQSEGDVRRATMAQMDTGESAE